MFMNGAKEINEFIRERFDFYSFDYEALINNARAGSKPSDSPMFQGDTLDMALVDTAAMVLGVAPEALLSMNAKETYKWYDKYPFFFYQIDFIYSIDRSHHGEGYDELRMFDAIFETNLAMSAPIRYDPKAVIERIVALLRDVDKSLPGTYHEGANITQLSITTSYFCSFRHISRMVRSYIDMVNRVKELFYKAWDCELCVDEIHEYNFLVSALGIYDRAYIGRRLYYDILRKFVGLYRAEGYKCFSTYVRINHHCIPPFWACTGFVRNKELVRQFIDVCPDAKWKMGEFARNVSQFQCQFVWSDAKRIHLSPEDEEDAAIVSEALGLDPNVEEVCALETTRVYIPKTKEEMSGDDRFARALTRLSGPASMGGVSTHIEELANLDEQIKFERMASRHNALMSLAGG